MEKAGSEAKTLKRIFLIRHYTPEVNRTGFFNIAEATQFISDYDAASLINQPFTYPAGLPPNPGKVYCSTLLRARQTARLLFGDNVELIEDPLFNEFQRKIFRLPLLKFPVSVWLTGARLLWLLGLNSKGIETFKQARNRARKCAENLSKLTETEHEVILVAHGFLNAFIRKALKKTGWTITRHDGNGFLSVTELVKTVN